MDVVEKVARRLYAAWCRPDEPEWGLWNKDAVLNGEYGKLYPSHFRETAQKVRDGVARILCKDNRQVECSECTFESCLCDHYHLGEADAVLDPIDTEEK